MPVISPTAAQKLSFRYCLGEAVIPRLAAQKLVFATVAKKPSIP